MVELRDRDTYIVTPQATDSGAGAAAMVIVALILVAIVGYMIYAFSMNPPQTLIERNTNTTIQQPVAVPTPAAPTNSAAPPTSSDNTSMPSSNQ